MTQVEILNSFIGTIGYLTVKNISFPVKVVDSKCTFGQIKIQVQPYFGRGNIWLKVMRFDRTKKMWINEQGKDMFFDEDSNADKPIRDFINQKIDDYIGIKTERKIG